MDIDPDIPDDELDKLLREAEAVSKEIDGIYVPHKKQRLFHCATNKVRAVFGGNRSGKTQMGANEARFHATGEYPDFYPESCKWFGPTRGRIVVTDYKVAGREVLEPTLVKWFSDRIIKIERSMGNISKVHVRHITGGISTFDVLTHEQETKQFEGWSGHWVWFDEPPPQDKYVACKRGMVDYGGRMWITATPLNEPWMFDELVLNTLVNAWTITVSIWDNPYLTKENIDDFLQSLTPEQREAREDGKFLHLTGRIYGEFSTNVHLVEELPQGHQSWPIYFVLDPADRRPHHGIWAKVDPMGNIFIYDEIVKKDTIKGLSHEIMIREVVRKEDPLVCIRILDPNKGNSPSPVTGLKLVDEFAKHAVYFLATVNDDLATGHLAVKEVLAYDKKEEISSTNHPKLYFVRDRTRECVKQLLSYVWDDWRGSTAGSKSEKERPKDINKDMPDCVRYLIMSKPIYHNVYETDAPISFMDRLQENM